MRGVGGAAGGAVALGEIVLEGREAGRGSGIEGLSVWGAHEALGGHEHVVGGWRV